MRADEAAADEDKVDAAEVEAAEVEETPLKAHWKVNTSKLLVTLCRSSESLVQLATTVGKT